MIYNFILFYFCDKINLKISNKNILCRWRNKMDFRIDKEHENFILKVREFTEKYVKPVAAEVDRKAEAPIENIKKNG